jgi:hypothetical protein
MDEALSRLMPQHKIGSDGFNWWIGQVEDESKNDPDVKGQFRYKVRIVGEHVKNCEIVGKDDLPWAQVLMPVTAPMSAGGPVQGQPHLYVGCWVIGFYLDPDKQKPIIMGALGQLIGSTGLVNEYKPDECNSFTTYMNPKSNPYTDGPSKVLTPKTETGEVLSSEPGKDATPPAGSGGSTSQSSESAAPKASTALRVLDDLAAEKICATLPDGCGKEADFGEQMNIIVGDLLAEIQRNGGSFGTSLVNKATGEVSDVLEIGTKYIGKAIALVRKLLAKVKGIVINGLKKAVDALIKAILRQDENGNALTATTEYFNNALKKLGCSIEDIGERLAEFLTDLLMGYIEEIYRMAACQVDLLVNGILNQIQSELDKLIGDVLGFISEILGPVGDVLNIVGEAVSTVLELLGITCSGGDRTCAKWRKACSDGDDDKPKEDEENFLDELFKDLEEGIDGIFPNLGEDNTIYSCPDAYTGTPLTNTTVGFVGGTPATGATTSGTSQTDSLVYEIDDVIVTEGNAATFTVTRSGSINRSSSLSWTTVDSSAIAGDDYIAATGTLTFGIGDTSQTLQVFTISDTVTEQPETFEVYLTNLTPDPVAQLCNVVFTKNVGQGTIVEAVVPTPTTTTAGTPSTSGPPNFTSVIQNPAQTLSNIFPPVAPPAAGTPGAGQGGLSPLGSEYYQLSADKTVVAEGDFITYTITTFNVPDGTAVNWVISGTNINVNDIVGGTLVGTAVISQGSATVVIGIEDDSTVEGTEKITFTVAGKGISADVLIVEAGGTGTPPNLGVGAGDPSTITTIPTLPSADEIITDANGGILQIPVKNPGSPYVIPPYVVIGGLGYGATGQALLDDKGFVTEIRVTNPGFGYKLNRPANAGLRCIIDSFTMIRPGLGYTSAPTVWVNGRNDVAEAQIDDGRVVGIRVLDRETTFDSYPEVLIIGGGGLGAKWIPSFACLDTNTLAEVGSTKIGTGKYIDCP